MTAGAEDLAFRARALAQAHPFTPLAKKLVDGTLAEERECQPVADVGVWAGAALTAGYCLRRVEESEAGLVLEATDGADVDVERLDAASDEIAAQVRRGTMDDLLVDDERTIAALDRIIASELSRRIETWRQPDGRRELEEYLTWWTVKGYALRAAERSLGALV